MALPFLTTYDPPGSSEGTLDPLGLYQVADQLGVMLVPAVRERMQRIRFLTAMAVGSMLTEGLEDNPNHRDGSPYLVWEWHLTEAMVRCEQELSDIDGVPGTLVTRRAIRQHGYLDARSYLKTPRIFGFFGVYKRLAIHLDILTVHLSPGQQAEPLVDAWARDQGFGGIKGAQTIFNRWRKVIAAGLSQKPPRTKVPSSKTWEELAWAFAPAGAKARERKWIFSALHGAGKLEALPPIWKVISQQPEIGITEESVHKKLALTEPSLAPLIGAIQAYETFSRSVHDAFDTLRAVAGANDARGYEITDVAADPEFRASVENLHTKACSARDRLQEIGNSAALLSTLFDRRFGQFLKPLSAGDCAVALCDHHEAVQRGKSSDGKRPWFDRIGEHRIYLRQAYRMSRRENFPGQYLHGYRTNPIQRFHRDLT